ncbi:MAG: hypothetical protein WBG05_08595 [Thermoanaerobaculia bacterium]
MVILRCRGTTAPGLGPRRLEPVACGVPWPRGTLPAGSGLALRDARGQRVPLQTRFLDYWPDGSVRWTLLDWLADAAGDDQYQLEVIPDSPPIDDDGDLTVQWVRPGESLVVDTGITRFELARGATFPFAAVDTGGSPALASGRSGLWVESPSGRRYPVGVDGIEVAASGPVRAEIHLRGHLPDLGHGPAVELTARLHFWTSSPTVRIELTIANPRPAGHPRGRWSLGRRGSIFLRDLAVVLALPEVADDCEIRFSPEIDSPWEQIDGSCELYQDSSGGENWASRVHLNRHGRVPNTFRGYRLRSGDSETHGLRATPAAAIQQRDSHLAVAVEHFWQNFPKALEVSPEAITIRLYPHQYADDHEIQGGEQKTHTFHVAFARDRVTAQPLDWCRSPLLVHAEPAWYAEAAAVPFLTPRSEDPNTGYLDLVDTAIEGADTFAAKAERIDEYGWRNFGDLYADHEAVSHRGTDPLVSHYNNQYDAVYGFALQFMRSADPRWFRLMDRLARHYIDIDIYHTDGDKAAYNHGHFWHTLHYTDAGTGTHRAFPPAKGVQGGGPSGGHLYTSGLLLYYLLTGYSPARDAVVSSGAYAIGADDGSKTVFRLLDRGHTGVVSSSGDDRYHGPSRNPANTINALLDTHRAEGHRRFLDKAEQLIRRCIHPDDDLEQRNLLDAESRWFYTMFLQSLGKYLDYKAGLGELDFMYSYARSSLLHYAAWAAQHEYPYLEKPDILEFPTETWAAQDMRKSEVFKLAASHSTAETRQLFLERARYFFDRSVDQLSRKPTRTLCRPVVLMLTLGYSQSYFDTRPVPTAPPPDEKHDVGEPETFVPQKERAKRKLLRAGAIGVALMGVAAMIGYMLWR